MPIAGQTEAGQLGVPSTLARLNYFYGQLLAQRDLRAEQGYHVMLRRLMQRETFGLGTVAGLRVRAAGVATARGVVVEPGLAMDPDGRELLVEAEVCIEVAAPALVPSSATPISGTTAADIATSLDAYWHFPIDAADVDALRAALVSAGLSEVQNAAADPTFVTLVAQLNRIADPVPSTLPPGTTLRDFLFAALVGRSFLGLRYLERGTDPSPSVLDASCCGDTTCQPSRLQQGATLVLATEPLPALPDAYELARIFLSACFLDEENPETTPPYPITIPFPHNCRSCLTDYVLAAWRPLAAADTCGASTLPVVSLARIYWSRYPREPGGQTRILDVDNSAFRPLAPGTPAVRALVEVATQCAPSVVIPPFFTAVAPANGSVVVVGSEDNELVLEVTANSYLTAVDGPPTGVPRWELDYYPPASPPATPSRYKESDPGTTPFGVAFALVDEPGRSKVRLTLTVATGPVLLPGTYVWRINVPDANSPPFPDPPLWTLFGREQPAAFVDGDPNPATTVPSGSGSPGGVFEWRFAVTSGT